MNQNYFSVIVGPYIVILGRIRAAHTCKKKLKINFHFTGLQVHYQSILLTIISMSSALPVFTDTRRGPVPSGVPRQPWSSCFCQKVLLVPDQACKEERTVTTASYWFFYSTSGSVLQFGKWQLSLEYEKTFIVYYFHIVRSAAAA